MKMTTGKLSGKAGGYYLNLAASVISLAALVIYLIFGIVSGTFAVSVFASLLGGTVLGIILLFYDGFVGDYIPLGMVLLYSMSLAFMIEDSINDITAMFVGMGNLFGNAANVPVRVVVAVGMLISILLSVIGSFKKRTKK